MRFFGFIAMATVVFLIFAIPIGIMIVSALGVVMPWLLLGLACWAVFSIARGPRRQVWSRHSWQPQPWSGYRGAYRSQPWARPQPRPPAPVPQAPAAPPPAPKPAELPIDVQVKVEQIRRKVEVLLGFASRFPPFSKDLYLVRQTASEYLPRTVDAYIALPADDREVVIATSGKTALQEMKEQLDLLDQKLNEIAEDLQRQDQDRLLANRRFLEDRFGSTKV
jgi:hypothetical protein